MKAHQLIADATFDPDQLKAIRKAFDDAWAQIAPQISQRPDAIEAGRLKLASIVLSVAKRGTLDPKQLSEEAMKLMFTPPTELGEIIFEGQVTGLTIPQKQVAPADKQNLRVLQDQKHFSGSGSVRTFLLQPRYTVLLLRDALLPRADQVFNFVQLVRVNSHWACNQNNAR